MFSEIILIKATADFGKISSFVHYQCFRGMKDKLKLTEICIENVMHKKSHLHTGESIKPTLGQSTYNSLELQTSNMFQLGDTSSSHWEIPALPMLLAAQVLISCLH